MLSYANGRCLWISVYMEFVVVASMLIVAGMTSSIQWGKAQPHTYLSAISIFRTYILLGRKLWVVVLLTTLPLASTGRAMASQAPSFFWRAAITSEILLVLFIGHRSSFARRAELHIIWPPFERMPPTCPDTDVRLQDFHYFYLG